MGNGLGVMIAGLGGAIGGTVVAGTEVVRRGIVPPLGIFTEAERMPESGRFSAAPTKERPLIKDALGLVPLEDFRFSGWDLQTASLYESVRRDKVVRDIYYQSIEDYLRGIVPLGAVVHKDGVYRGGNNATRFETLREATDALRRDIDNFRKEAGVDRVVVVNLTPTFPTPDDTPIFSDLDKFEAALDTLHPSITSGMLYFYAACKESCAHLNFTPNVIEVPSLRELAKNCKIPIAGRDGKTGQTFLKTVLAPAFRARQLKVRGWFSTNILGNADGKALSQPDALKTKVVSKSSVLEDIVGYPVVSESGESSHVVTIHYYPIRGDAKEAWDNIDLAGFLNAAMQVKVNFLCKDSILAAPLVIDMARMGELALRRGEFGIMEHLSIDFKSPLPNDDGLVVHHFFEQERMMIQYLEKCVADINASK